MHAKELKSQMIKGPLVVGGHVFLTDESISELMALSGYDFVWIDAEHGAFDRKTILSHIIAASSGGAASIVRVVDIDIAAVKPVLEMGPDGIIFPHGDVRRGCQTGDRFLPISSEGNKGLRSQTCETIWNEGHRFLP